MRKYLYLIILCVVFAGCKGSQQKGNTSEVTERNLSPTAMANLLLP